MKKLLFTAIAVSFVNTAFAQCPIVDAGPDQTICCGQSVTLNGSAPGAASVSWTNGNPGANDQFDDYTLLNTVYTAGISDCLISAIILELGGIPGCPSSKDQMTIFVHDMQPRLYTAPDQILAPTATDVTVSAHHMIGGLYSGIWTTTGTGSFDDATSINTIYHPSTEDKDLGNVILTYTSLNACNYIQSADMSVNFSMISTTNTLNKFSKENIKISPNPSLNGIISIELAEGTSISEIKVLNALQSLVLNTEIKISDNKATLDCSNLNSGIYFIWVSDRISNGFQRLVILD